MDWLLAPLLFFLPAGIGNMAPIFANRIPFYNRWTTSLDFGKSHDNKRIFGDNKTWRGLFAGTLAGGLSALLLASLFGDKLELSFMVGCALGFGALAGDTLESYLKRRIGIKPGNSWFPFDQIDYIVGGIICSLPFVRYTLSDIVVIVIVYFGLHLLMSYVGFLLKLKQHPI